MTRSEALLSLPEDIQALLDNGLSADAGYQLSRLHDDPAGMRLLAQEIVAGRVSRDGTAKAVQDLLGKRSQSGRSSRLPLRLAGGINVTLSADTPLTWDVLLSALEAIRKSADQLKRGGKEVCDLAKSLAPPRGELAVPAAKG